MAIQDITKPMALDETLQATNTALGLLGKDTTLQSIVTALAGIGINTVGNLASLVTADKTSLVGAVNEVAGNVDDIDTAKADKVDSATSGNLASLDGNGNLADSGWKSDKTTTAVSGNPISISGLKSNQLAINPIIMLEPIQAGSGDPSPVNERPISGYDKIEVLSCGKNLFDDSKAEFSSYTYSYNNGTFSNVATDSRDFFAFSVVAFDKDNNVLAGPGIEVRAIGRTAVGVYVGDQQTEYIMIGHSGASTDIKITYNIKLTGYFVVSLNVLGYNPSVVNGLSFNDIQIEEGQIPTTTYVPYHKTTDLSLQIGQTIYGATLDLEKGVLTVDRGIVDLGDLNFQYYEGSAGQYPARFAVLMTNMLAECQLVCEVYRYIDNWTGETDDEVVLSLGGYITIVDSTYGNDVNAFKTAVSGKKIVYYLATPFTIQLTPHEISLLSNYAYVSTNGTSMSFSYHNGEMASLADVAQLGQTVNELGSQITNNNFGSMIDLSTYNTESNMYTFPSDGYLLCRCANTGSKLFGVILGASSTNVGTYIELEYVTQATSTSTYVRKGMRTYLYSSTASIVYGFIPLV